MKTPYDGALRVRRRELDELRVDVARQTAEVARLADQRETITTDLRVEAEAARDALSTMIDFGAYADRMTRRAAHIDAEKIVAEGQLDTLIDAARDSYGSYKAIGQAAQNFRSKADLAADRQEQSALDEVASRTDSRSSQA